MTDLGTEIQRIKARLSAIERSSRLGAAAIDDTSLEVRDDTGSLRALVGQQGDGTTAVNVVNGPIPPAPTAPLVASVIGGVAAEWDGQLVGGAGVPLDFSRVEVHAAATSGFTPSAATLVGTVETAQGAMVVIPTATPIYVRLLTRTTSGTASTPSAENGPIAPALIVADDVADGIITGTKLAADAIDGKTITGAIIRTASTGQRIVMDGATGTITGYDSSNVTVFTINPAGGFTTYAPEDEDAPATQAQLSAARLLMSADIPGEEVIPTRLSIEAGSAPFAERHVVTELQGGYTLGYAAPFIRIGSSSPDFERDVDISTDNMSIALTSDLRLGGAGLAIDEVSQGRGRKGFVAIQTNTSTTTTTEIAAITTPSLTFVAGRAYRVTYHGLLVSSVAADIVRARVWRGSIGGSGVSLVDSIHAHQVPVAGQQVLMDMQQIVVNSTASNVTAPLIATVLRASGTGNVQVIANSNNPAWLDVQDIGLATDYPSARAV
ncbi:hypothetical protein [Streptomyces gardneri]|uniref:hypothetical protein n=1 Tax=Streptomyces gardneri TaxID=66892 RepID=UPI0036BF65BB